MFNLNQEEVKKTQDKIQKSNTIALIAHKNPDGDALGSVLAFKEYLERIHKKVTAVTIGPIADKYYFLPEISEFKNYFDPDNFDLIISCDSGAEIMTGFDKKYPDLFKKNPKLINIDHHPSNNGFGGINIINTQAASTTCILFELLQLWEVKISEKMAQNLLTGVCTDTGSFMHTNTTPQTYRVASKLIALGGDVEQIQNNLFKNKKMQTLKLWGKVFENINLNQEGIAISVITKKDLASCQAKYDDLSGVVDYINSIPEAKFAMLLTEKDDVVKGSMRTQKEVDLDKVASGFGGGGHKKAAGFTIPGHLESETIWKIVD